MRLSPRQREVFREMLNGCCYDAIAARLGIGKGSARAHALVLYAKLQVTSREQLMARYMKPTPEAEQLMRNN